MNRQTVDTARESIREVYTLFSHADVCKEPGPPGCACRTKGAVQSEGMDKLWLCHEEIATWMHSHTQGLLEHTHAHASRKLPVTADARLVSSVVSSVVIIACIEDCDTRCPLMRGSAATLITNAEATAISREAEATWRTQFASP